MTLQTPVPVPDLAGSLARIAMEIDSLFETALLKTPHDANRLRDAMHYASVGGGKRMRPLLLVEAATLFDVPRPLALRAGLAVECIHVHSLIHDDLPCMDDDDLRRGRATVHCAFDEATAVLAGDALHAMAFEILAHGATHPDPAIRIELVMDLARAAGLKGMAGGQMLDMESASACLADVTRLNQLKTGALICWCLEAGAAMGYADGEARKRLRTYGLCVGLAFQIADDLLDLKGNVDCVGKRVGKDAEQGKCTFVTILGEASARREAGRLIDQAVHQLESFGSDAELLRRIARFAVERDR